ncbi:MAG: rRNA maturation RNase YbeY [Alphaproteobacteria bacterium]|nr:rRNA maturation RNase YbeY [Alphaproteobacteria bacterium]
MNRLVAETNIATQEFKQFDDLNLWIDTAFQTVANAPNLKAEANGTIGLLLTSDDEIKKLNANFRQQDKATNVLSFPAVADEFDALFEDGEPKYLGDIAMAYETLTREASDQKKPIMAHFIHLLIHSILHLLGYDHIEDADAAEMENTEIRLLKTIAIENPYH